MSPAQTSLSLRWRQVLVPIGAVAVAAAIGWLATPLPNVTPDLRSDERWRLPQWPSAETKPASELLAQRNLWGAPPPRPGAAPAPAAPLTPPDWRIVATAVTGTDRVAMLRIGAETPQELRVGDKLPGGAIIRAIEADRLVIQIDGKRRILRIPPP